MTLSETWSGRRTRLFTGKPISEGPFRERNWRTSALPFGLDMSRDDFLRLKRGLAAIGTRKLAVCGLRDEFPRDQTEFITSLQTFSPQSLFADSPLGVIESGVFDDGADWALACSPDGFSVLAAASAEFSILTERLGGESELSARVRRMIDEGEFGTPQVARPLIEHFLGGTGEGAP